MYSVSVIIPCLKEAENLKFLLPQIIESLKDSTATFEIIIVDNSVPLDDTPNICSKFLEVQYINTIGTDNYGNAVRTGIASSNHNYILFMDADGSQSGYDLDMIRAISRSVSIPVIASGGAGSPEHLAQALQIGEADADLAASIFHYGTHSIREVKTFLSERGIPMRQE